MDVDGNSSAEDVSEDATVIESEKRRIEREDGNDVLPKIPPNRLEHFPAVELPVTGERSGAPASTDAGRGRHVKGALLGVLRNSPDDFLKSSGAPEHSLRNCSSLD